MSFEIDRHRYAELFGPTEGDSIRLGDTDLFIKIEEFESGLALLESNLNPQILFLDIFFSVDVVKDSLPLHPLCLYS